MQPPAPPRPSLSLYGGADPRDLPLYSQWEAAHFIGVSPSTIRGWINRRAQSGPEGSRFREPLIIVPDENDGRLSFNNLVEAYVINSLRTKHAVSIKAVRQALQYAEEELGVDRLLLRRELCWSGDLFWDELSSLINLSRSGQFAMRQVVESYLHRIDWDEATGLPIRLFPFITTKSEAKSVVIDPRISFGQPTLRGKGVSTAVIARRVDAGEEVADVARDYDVDVDLVHDALIYETVS